MGMGMCEEEERERRSVSRVVRGGVMIPKQWRG